MGGFTSLALLLCNLRFLCLELDRRRVNIQFQHITGDRFAHRFLDSIQECLRPALEKLIEVVRARGRASGEMT